jgi:hypothetical protein
VEKHKVPIPKILQSFNEKHCPMLLQGAHPLYRPARTADALPASDPLCEGAQHENPNQCDYEISYADGSSSMGVYVRDSMQFVGEDGERENEDIVFGYGPTFQYACTIAIAVDYHFV